MTDLPLCGDDALMVLWTGSAIAAGIFAVMVYSIVSCKSAITSQGAFVHRTSVEVVWAIIPILILIVTATPAVKPLIAIDRSCSSVTTAALHSPSQAGKSVEVALTIDKLHQTTR